MPRSKSPQALTGLLLQTVVDNIALFCENESLSHLPELLASEIRKALSHKGQLHVRYARKLITRKTIAFHVTRLEEQYILEILAWTCPELRTLIYSGTGFQMYTTLNKSQKIFSRFPQLTLLDLSESTANNESLKVLGTCCPLLEALSVSHCIVSNTGLRSLSTNTATGARQCQHLVYLYIRHTCVCGAGIRSVIENLPNLKYLDTELSIPELSSDRNIILPLSRMKSFVCSSNGSIFLDRVIDFSSNVQIQSKRNVVKVSDQVLASLVHPMQNPPIPSAFSRPILNTTITYAKGILPFITRFGSTLEFLHIRDMYDIIDVLQVLRKCPKLLTLYFENNSLYYSPVVLSRIPPQPSSFNLTKFAYRGVTGGEHPSDNVLVNILKSRSLTSISVIMCDTLSDQVLLDSFAVSQFRNLTSLELCGCHLISLQVFSSVFLGESNDLKEIAVVNCRQLSTVEIESEWNLLALQNNWDVKFKFNYPDAT